MTPEFGVCFPGRLRDELDALGVVVHDLGVTRFSRPWTPLLARRRLDRVLELAAYDVVVCHLPWVQALFGEVVRRRGLPFVAYFHGPRSGGWAERLAVRGRPSLIIGPSRHTIEGYSGAFADVPAHVLPYPLPSHVAEAAAPSPWERESIRREFGAGPEDVVFLQASRMEAWKGPDQCLKAFARLRDLPGWRFWVAGGVQRPSERPLFDSLVRIAEEAGIGDRVRFLGHRTDIARILRAADVYCQGNRGAEGFGLAFLEAGYCGLPVVTTDLGPAREVIHPTTGILVPPGEDVTPLSDAFRTMIVDSPRRARMARLSSVRARLLADPDRQINGLAVLLEGASRSDGVAVCRRRRGSAGALDLAGPSAALGGARSSAERRNRSGEA